jgi:hypothetical protein
MASSLLRGNGRDSYMDRKESPLSQEKAKATRLFSPFIAYLLLFYGFWIGWVSVIYSPMQALGSTACPALITMRGRGGPSPSKSLSAWPSSIAST